MLSLRTTQSSISRLVWWATSTSSSITTTTTARNHSSFHAYTHTSNPILRSSIIQRPQPTRSKPPTPSKKMSYLSMSKRLAGKTILITGASSGIGRSTAIELSRTAPSDLRLILTARRMDRLETLKSEIAKDVGEGVKVLPVKLDMSSVSEIKSFVANLPPEFADIDALVNNAGMVRGVAQAPDIIPEDIDVMFATNVTGLIALTQEVIKIFKKRDEGGRGDILMLGSIAGREGYPGGSIYCATKAAVRSFTEALRKELIATRIRVMEIDPGQVETEFSLIRFGGDEAKAKKVYEGVEPLTPDDIAEIIVFMLGRRENVVLADSLVFPNHQAAATVMHRKTTS